MGVRNVQPDLTLDVTALVSTGYESLKYVVSWPILSSVRARLRVVNARTAASDRIPYTSLSHYLDYARICALARRE